MKEPLADFREVSGGAESLTPDIRVRFFENFEVFYRGETLELGHNSKAIAIFKCLLQRGQPISQDILRGWLWPDSSPKKARWSLNSAVYALRRSLDDSPPSEAIIPDFVILERGQYRLTKMLRISSDVEEFDASYERGRFLERTGKTKEAASEYERALALYRDDYLAKALYKDCP